MWLHSTIPHGNHSPAWSWFPSWSPRENIQPPCGFALDPFDTRYAMGKTIWSKLTIDHDVATTSGQFRRTSDDVNLPPVSEMYVPQCRDPTTGSRCKKCLATYLDNSIEPWTDKVHPAVPEIYVLRSPAARPLKSGTNKTHPVRRAMR